MHISNIQEFLQKETEQLKTTDLYISDSNATTDDYIALFKICSHLRKLRIYNTQNATLPSFQILKRIKHLELRCTLLSTLPNLQILSQLENLELYCPQLASIPEHHFPMTLKHLKCSSDQLLKIPTCLWQSQKLETLNLSGNSLKNLTIPDQLKLKKLRISINDLETIQFGDLPVVTEVELSSNQLTTINESFSNMPNIYKLRINAPINTVTCDFSSATTLRDCHFNKWRLTDYSFLSTIKSVSYLSIQNPQTGWQNLPDLSTFKWLSRLYISKCADTTITISDPSNSSLNVLDISDSEIIFQPSLFTKYSRLKYISLRRVPSIDFSECVQHLPSIQSLYLYETSIHNFDKIPNTASLEWKRLGLLKSNLQIDNLDFLDHFPKLDFLELGENEISSPYIFLRKRAVPITNIPTNIKNYKFKNRQQFLSICAAIERADLTRADKELFVDYFMQIPKVAINQDWTWSTLLKASNISLPTIRKKLRSILEEKMNNALKTHPITQQSVVYITGKPKVKKREIQQLLKTLKIELVNTYSDKVTHVLLGMDSPDYDLLDQQLFTPITGVVLQKLVVQQEPQLLKENLETTGTETTEMLENLERLILSTDEINMNIGLEMIEQGGLPKGLFGSLLVVQKTTPHTKIRKRIKAILEVYAEEEWLEFVRDRLVFTCIHASYRPEQATSTKLKSLAKRTNSTVAGKFSCLLFQKLGIGLRYALTSRVPQEIKNKAYQLLIKDQYFDLSKGLAYTNRAVEDKNRAYRSGYRRMGKTPLDLPETVTICSLNLSKCYGNKLSKKLLLFKDLKHLDLSTNSYNELPSWLGQLKHLESIDLRDNYFEEFPAVLANLPNLKQIDMRDNYFNEIPTSFITKQPDCEVVLEDFNK